MVKSTSTFKTKQRVPKCRETNPEFHAFFQKATAYANQSIEKLTERDFVDDFAWWNRRSFLKAPLSGVHCLGRVLEFRTCWSLELFLEWLRLPSSIQNFWFEIRSKSSLVGRQLHKDMPIELRDMLIESDYPMNSIHCNRTEFTVKLKILYPTNCTF